MEKCISKQNIPSDKEMRMEIVAEDDMEIRADRMHLVNIVCNLLENAIKYSVAVVNIMIDYKMREDGMVQTPWRTKVSVSQKQISGMCLTSSTAVSRQRTRPSLASGLD